MSVIYEVLALQHLLIDFRCKLAKKGATRMSSGVCYGEARLTAKYSEPNRHRPKRFSVSVGIPLQLTWRLQLHSGIAQVKIVTGEISRFIKRQKSILI